MGRSNGAAVKNRGKGKGKNKHGRKGKGGKKCKSDPKPPPRYTAKTADPHELYQLSVNSPEEDVKFLRRAFRHIRGRDARHLREDFCGTALLCSEWVKTNGATAEGFDIDAGTLDWGREHNLAPLGDRAGAITLHQADVRAPSDVPPDVRCAHNFSWCCFNTREELLAYFRAVREDLGPDGILTLDIHGGPESMEELEEAREIEEGFDYVWDQDGWEPATGRYTAHIHFRFEDGSELTRAFTYDWRLWFLTEVVDVLKDAGFPRVETWWEGTDDDGESGDGEFEPDEKGENSLSWITYVIAAK